jgi:hypothetical protein
LLQAEHKKTVKETKGKHPEKSVPEDGPACRDFGH